MERLDPNFTQGRWRIDHLARYHWAALFSVGARVLDAATGCGYGAALLKKAGAVEVVGVDRSAEAITWAREKYDIPAVRFEEADLMSLDRAGLGTFNLVVSFETLEHLTDPDKCVQILSSMLAPSGRFLCSVPSEFYSDNKNPFHLTQFDRESFAAMLRSHFGSVVVFEQRFNIGSEIVGEAGGSTFDVIPRDRHLALPLRDQLNTPPDCYLALCDLAQGALVESSPVLSLSSVDDWRADESEVRRVVEQIRSDADKGIIEARTSIERAQQDAIKGLDQARIAIERAQQDATLWRNEAERMVREWNGQVEANQRLAQELEVIRNDAQSALLRAQDDAVRWRTEAQRLALVWEEQRRQLEEKDRLILGAKASGRGLQPGGGFWRKGDPKAAAAMASETLRWRNEAERSEEALNQLRARLDAAEQEVVRLTALEQRWRAEVARFSHSPADGTRPTDTTPA